MQSPCSPLESMLTLDAAAAYLDMSRSSFERHVQPFIAVVYLTPGKTRVEREELDRWKEAPQSLPGMEVVPDVEGVYFLQHETDGNIKIGRSIFIRKRVLALRNSSPVPVRFLGCIETREHEEIERSLHERLRTFRVHGEWFRNLPPVRLAVSKALGLHV